MHVGAAYASVARHARPSRANWIYLVRRYSQQPHITKELHFPGSLPSTITRSFEFADPDNIKPFETARVLGIDGKILDSDYEVPLEAERLVQLYKNMITISVLDRIMYDAQRQGRLSFYMVSAGEEGIAVGSAAALEKDDQMFCQYREQGAILTRGYTIKQMMAQLYGNNDDTGLGRMMPVHYQSKELNVHPITSPLCSQLTHAAGAAYALKMDGTQSVALCYFGEGAASEGDFHAALNIAATRGCPALFMCRNNGYAISTPTSDQYRGDGIASRGIGYGIPTIRIDGNDMLAVYRATREARELALKRRGPVLVEAMSYRVSHHSTSDDSFTYRSRTEVEEWKRYDNPLTRMRKYLEHRQLWDADKEAAELGEVRKAILREIAAAEKVTKPALRTLFTDVYETMPKLLEEQAEELDRIVKENKDHYNLSAYDGGAQ